jgi:hypothetical protein
MGAVHRHPRPYIFTVRTGKGLPPFSRDQASPSAGGFTPALIEIALAAQKEIIGSVLKVQQ